MPKRSRETCADMINSYIFNKPFVDAVNTINVGQVNELPIGSCIETLACIDGNGVQPLLVPNIPEHLLEIMRPQAICQKWTTDGVLKRDRNLLMQALYRDPQCAHLKPEEISSMASELFKANSRWFNI